MRRALGLALAAATVCGCTLEPRYVRPAPAIPATWPKGEAYPPPSGEALPALSYRDLFGDARLLGLIDQALAGNQNLRAAMANAEITRAQHRIQRAELFPRVEAAAGASESRTVNVVGSGASATVRSYDVSLGVSSFEIDLFGRLRSLSRSAQEQYLASEAGARAARLTLVSEVADSFLNLAADRSLLAISADTVASATRTVALTRARLEGGVAARTDLAQAETLLETARADEAHLVTQVALDRNALELLVGSSVADSALPASLEEVDGRFAEAPAGLDSRILLRRPDVLEAEYRLRAANARIGAARAAFFPTISLTGLAGYASPQLGSLFAGRNFPWQAEALASQPIFAGGANLGGLALARGERDLAVANYQQAIQSAFRDVADALARRGTIEQQLSAEEALVAAASTSYELAFARYRAGVNPYLDALVAQRTLYVARQSLTVARLSRATNLVALYSSLAGDPVMIDSTPSASQKENPRADEASAPAAAR